jgi:hypothetical protein
MSFRPTPAPPEDDKTRRIVVPLSCFLLLLCRKQSGVRAARLYTLIETMDDYHAENHG